MSNRERNKSTDGTSLEPTHILSKKIEEEADKEDEEYSQGRFQEVPLS